MERGGSIRQNRHRQDQNSNPRLDQCRRRLPDRCRRHRLDQCRRRRPDRCKAHHQGQWRRHPLDRCKAHHQAPCMHHHQAPCKHRHPDRCKAHHQGQCSRALRAPSSQCIQRKRLPRKGSDRQLGLLGACDPPSCHSDLGPTRNVAGARQPSALRRDKRQTHECGFRCGHGFPPPRRLLTSIPLLVVTTNRTRARHFAGDIRAAPAPQSSVTSIRRGAPPSTNLSHMRS